MSTPILPPPEIECPVCDGEGRRTRILDHSHYTLASGYRSPREVVYVCELCNGRGCTTEDEVNAYYTEFELDAEDRS